MKTLFQFFLGLLFFCSQAFSGDVNFDASLQRFNGSFSLVAFFQSVGIMLFALGFITVIKLSIDAFRRPFGGGTRK